MAQPYVGEIRMLAGNFAPVGWMFCEGQLLSISEYETLFNLIGTTYGGDGQSTFGLPDLRGRLPIHYGAGYTLAQTGGVETVTLTNSQIQAHSHPVSCVPGPGNQRNPIGNVWAASAAGEKPYSSELGNVPLQPLAASGGSQPHNNLPPYLCVSFIICLFGIYPSQV
ncbi:MAG TPA: tail fiber protein [Chloroflexota bacterium]|nr:tail fiber protein [Chloroflexota bacterium]